jgi:hypothetical protein
MINKKPIIDKLINLIKWMVLIFVFVVVGMVVYGIYTTPINYLLAISYFAIAITSYYVFLTYSTRDLNKRKIAQNELELIKHFWNHLEKNGIIETKETGFMEYVLEDYLKSKNSLEVNEVDKY